MSAERATGTRGYQPRLSGRANAATSRMSVGAAILFTFLCAPLHAQRPSDPKLMEPQKAPHVFQDVDNIIVTPHIGSRTFESVERQALRAVTNIVEFLKGGKDFIQANPF